MSVIEINPIAARTFDADTITLINAATAPLHQHRKNLVDATIKALKAGGVWTKLGLLYVLAAHDEQFSLLNWKNPGAVTLTHFGGGALVFAANQGWTGDGAQAFVASNMDDTPNLSQNDAHAGVWTLTNVASAGPDLGDGSAAGTDVQINPRNTSDQLVTSLNDAVDSTVSSITNSAGYVVVSRNSSSTYSRYKNGSSLGDATATSAALADTGLRIFGHGAARSTRQIALAHWGAALTSGEVAAAHTIFGTYLAEVGAI